MPANSRTSASEIVAGMTADLRKGKAPVLDAKQVTVLLKSSLQTERVAYLQVGSLLSLVREEKLYMALGHADLVSYGREELQLCRATLYRYLQVFDWVALNHKEWLNPGPDTFIPELNDVDDLMTIEEKLGQKGLAKSTKTTLESLRSKALTGTLVKSDLRATRGSSTTKPRDRRALFLKHLKALRQEGSSVSGLPAEILPGLDQFIGLLSNAMAISHLAIEESKKAPAA